jgi:hypothetical protein
LETKQNARACGSVVWEKALGYVSREPYRSLIAAELSRHRFNMALARDHVTKEEAVATLALARGTSPETVSALVYTVVRAAILLFEGAFCTRWLRSIRRRVLAQLLSFSSSCKPGWKSRSTNTQEARQ